MAASQAYILLTRPEGRSDSLAGRLIEAGFNVAQAPALRVTPLAVAPDTPGRATQFQLAVFVSGTAVRAYFEAMDDAMGSQGAFRWPQGCLAAAVGAGTAAALHGSRRVPAQSIMYSREPDSSHDSESLWPLLAERLPVIRRAWIVRGETGREWLGEALASAGVEVERLAVYRREPVIWGAAQKAWLENALASGAGCVTLLTSGEGVDAVCDNLRRFNLLAQWGATGFVAFHARIAQRLQSVLAASGKGQPPMVQICEPAEDSIYRALLLMASGRAGT